ncbi:hypothetical protein Tco_0004481 [Tanacetum coccineum]
MSRVMLDEQSITSYEILINRKLSLEYFKMVSVGSSRSIPADPVPAGYVIISVDRYREYDDLSYRRS